MTHSDHGAKQAYESHNASGSSHGRPYAQLALLFPIHVVIMYLLMFAMIDGVGDFWNNINMFWMALLMAAPMSAIMVLSMRGMYPDATKTAVALCLSAAIALGAWFGVRQQWGVGDTQFLRSMIPHHSGAIRMCRRASISDPRIDELCSTIETGQREEIRQMEAILAEN